MTQRVAVNLPIRPEPDAERPARFLADAAKVIEECGFSGVWVADAIGRGFPTADPLTALAVAATVTERVELGTCIVQLPLRPAVEVAHRILLLDMLAPGRLAIGFGAGSTAGDFAALDVPFEERFARLNVGLDEVCAVLANEPVRGITLSRWVERTPSPRLLVGAWADGRWLARAAELDGWIASAGKTSWGALKGGLARYRALGGRRAVVVNVPVRVRDHDSGTDSPVLIGTRETIRRRWERLVSLGFDDIVIAPKSHTSESLTDVSNLLGVGASAAA